MRGIACADNSREGNFVDKPLGAWALIEWTDTKEKVVRYFSFGQYNDKTETDTFGLEDDQIFYYAEGESELETLMIEPDQFKVLTWDLVYNLNDYQIKGFI
jgi:hypothetical protein